MKNKFLSTSLTLLLLLPASSFASPQPAACPSIAAIKSAGVHSASISMLGWMAMNFKQRYDTADEWDFGILVGAENEQEAIEKGNTGIGLLSYMQGPVPGDRDGDEENKWACTYANLDEDTPLLGIAYTPSSPMDAARFISRFRK